MKKKIMSIFLCSCLVLSITGCGINKIESEIKQKEEQVENVKNEKTETEEVSGEISEEEKEEDLQIVNDMLPLMDSVMLCILENNYDFDTTNSSFVWNVMEYYVANFLVDSENVTMSEDYSSAIVSKEDVSEYMRGYVLNSVPEFQPGEETPLITENENSYSFGLGDRGLSKSEIIGFSKNRDDSLDVDIRLMSLDDNTEICTATFRIEPINDESKYFPMVIVDVNLQMPQPVIQSGIIVEINDENIVLQVDGEKETYSMNENASNQIKTKAVGGGIDVMVEDDMIINILN